MLIEKISCTSLCVKVLEILKAVNEEDLLEQLLIITNILCGGGNLDVLSVDFDCLAILSSGKIVDEQAKSRDMVASNGGSIFKTLLQRGSLPVDLALMRLLTTLLIDQGVSNNYIVKAGLEEEVKNILLLCLSSESKNEDELAEQLRLYVITVFGMLGGAASTRGMKHNVLTHYV